MTIMDTDPIPTPDEAPPGIYDASGRPRFFADPAVDRLVSVVLQLTGEVWVLAEKLRNLEQLAERKGQLTHDEIVNFKPAPEDAAERDAERNRFIHSTLGPLREVRKS
jgi:hypothetical protein